MLKLSTLVTVFLTISFVAALPTATIDAGVIIGTTTSLPSATACVNKFLGIPFAASPPERFAPPKKPRPWSEPLEAKAWKPACIQQFNYPAAAREFIVEVFNNPPPTESEDCLYLNVYAPSTPPPPGGRAVLYWIYGGSLEFGNAGQPAYDGSFFAAYEDVIVVSVNYRTNVFGFPSSPELPLTGHNLGLLDQRLGLDWVQRNIHDFGGNPEKVTVFGESAGAFSVDALITSYPTGSHPPFRAAILESGTISYGPVRLTYTPSSVPAWDTLVAALNCTDAESSLTCVRNAPSTEIKSVIEHKMLKFNAVADNVTFVSDPAARRAAGNIAHVPVLSGTNAQEGRVFTVGQPVNGNITAFLETSLSLTDTALLSEIEALYPVGRDGLNTPYDVISQIDTDYIFQCPDAVFANATAASPINKPTWRYYFNATFPNTQLFPNAGVYHSSEIPIVFRTYPKNNATAAEEALSSFMQGAWASFAKNPMGGPGWNKIGSGASDLDLGDLSPDGPSGVTVIREIEVDAKCAFWTQLYDALGVGA